MRQFATLRATQAAVQAGEHAPLATACCNACRTCVTTNLIGIGTAAAGALGLSLRKLGGRLSRSW